MFLTDVAIVAIVCTKMNEPVNVVIYSCLQLGPALLDDIIEQRSNSRASMELKLVAMFEIDRRFANKTDTCR